MAMNIFLIGFMGSGKTTIGLQLSKKLNKQFIDLDSTIEAEQGKKISDIFSSQGEDAFRHIEHDTLLKVIETGNQVISVGGGAPCFHDNINCMNKNGITIYLKLSPIALTERLYGLPKHARDARPLIANKTKEELLEFIDLTLQKREHFYNQSKIIVMNEDSDSSSALERIVTALKFL